MDTRDTIKLVQSEYDIIVEPLKEIKQIVEEFFGEENVDFNIPNLLVKDKAYQNALL